MITKFIYGKIGFALWSTQRVESIEITFLPDIYTKEQSNHFRAHSMTLSGQYWSGGMTQKPAQYTYSSVASSSSTHCSK